MFTGIIEEIGTIHTIHHGVLSSQLTIDAGLILTDMHMGDSIAVNGVCLTVTSFHNNYFTADVMAETVRCTTLGNLHVGEKVNLERALSANGRFGGHIVSGHIDGTGTIQSFTRESNAIWVTIQASKKQLRYIIEKGSIAIDGISLTVAYVDTSCFRVSLIPHTGQNTTLTSKQTRDRVNLECDIVGKYVEKLLTPYTKESPKTTNISEAFLQKNGFM